MEIWKPVKGYEGYYEVSSYGLVRSLARDVIKSNGVVQHRAGKTKSPVKDHDGYYFAKLSKDGHSKTVKIHVLVAEAFVPGWFDGAEVNHKDYDRTNNTADNLEWVTHKENINHTLAGGRHYSQGDLRGEKNPNYGNTVLHERYMNNHKLATEKQSRPGVQNGRAFRVAIVKEDGTLMEFPYCIACAEYLIENNKVRARSKAAVASYISRAAKTGIPYYGMRFEIL